MLQNRLKMSIKIVLYFYFLELFIKKVWAISQHFWTKKKHITYKMSLNSVENDDNTYFFDLSFSFHLHFIIYLITMRKCLTIKIKKKGRKNQMENWKIINADKMVRVENKSIYKAPICSCEHKKQKSLCLNRILRSTRLFFGCVWLIVISISFLC